MKRTAIALLAAAGFSAPAAALDLDLYVGVDYLYLEAAHNLSHDVAGATPNAPQRTARTDSDGTGLKAHVGMWLNESFAVELQVGAGSDDAEATGQSSDNTLELDSYAGLFLIPRAEPFEWVDMYFPIGWAKSTVLVPAADGGGNEGATIESVDVASLAYGIDLKFKVGSLVFDPDSFLGSVTLSAGFMVYGDDKDVNVRGYNGGLQLGLRF